MPHDSTEVPPPVEGTETSVAASPLASSNATRHTIRLDKPEVVEQVPAATTLDLTKRADVSSRKVDLGTFKDKSLKPLADAALAGGLRAISPEIAVEGNRLTELMAAEEKDRAARIEVAREDAILKDKGRCTGACCERFFLPLAPDDLLAGFVAWKRDKDAAPIRMSDARPKLGRYDGPIGKLYPEDIWLLYPMLIPLEPASEEKAPKAIFPEDKNLHGDGWFYTCKHFDTLRGNCTIYDHRPAMCREYPDGSTCNYAACTWGEKRRLKPETMSGLVTIGSLRGTDDLHHALTTDYPKRIIE